jgi:hypothetical protein|tara:strand:+ start:280 stop:405 length:126 start_codon:yes stop_codon:yes gene_type:complete
MVERFRDDDLIDSRFGEEPLPGKVGHATKTTGFLVHRPPEG